MEPGPVEAFGSAPDALPPIRGTVLRRDDSETGFSPENPKQSRRYLVIDVHGDRVRMVPLCTEGPGVFLEAGTLENDEVSGYFIRWSTTVTVAQAAASSDDEHAPAALVEQVRAQWRRR